MNTYDKNIIDLEKVENPFSSLAYLVSTWRKDPGKITEYLVETTMNF